MMATVSNDSDMPDAGDAQAGHVPNPPARDYGIATIQSHKVFNAMSQLSLSQPARPPSSQGTTKEVFPPPHSFTMHPIGLNFETSQAQSATLQEDLPMLEDPQWMAPSTTYDPQLYPDTTDFLPDEVTIITDDNLPMHIANAALASNASEWMTDEERYMAEHKYIPRPHTHEKAPVVIVSPPAPPPLDDAVTPAADIVPIEMLLELLNRYETGFIDRIMALADTAHDLIHRLEELKNLINTYSIRTHRTLDLQLLNHRLAVVEAEQRQSAIEKARHGAAEARARDTIGTEDGDKTKRREEMLRDVYAL